jgi:hypothetical protein
VGIFFTYDSNLVSLLYVDVSIAWQCNLVILLHHSYIIVVLEEGSNVRKPENFNFVSTVLFCDKTHHYIQTCPFLNIALNFKIKLNGRSQWRLRLWPTRRVTGDWITLGVWNCLHVFHIILFSYYPTTKGITYKRASFPKICVNSFLLFKKRRRT